MWIKCSPFYVYISCFKDNFSYVFSQRWLTEQRSQCPHCRWCSVICGCFFTFFTCPILKLIFIHFQGVIASAWIGQLSMGWRSYSAVGHASDDWTQHEAWWCWQGQVCSLTFLLRLILNVKIGQMCAIVHSKPGRLQLSYYYSKCEVHRDKMSVYCWHCRKSICHQCALWGGTVSCSSCLYFFEWSWETTARSI